MSARLPLDPTAVDRLAKLAGMLGSDFAGERANAAEAATKLLKGAGLTWRDLVERAMQQPPEPEPELCRWEWREAAEALDELSWRLTPWERQFVASLLHRTTITEKQWRILSTLARKVAR